MLCCTSVWTFVFVFASSSGCEWIRMIALAWFLDYHHAPKKKSELLPTCDAGERIKNQFSDLHKYLSGCKKFTCSFAFIIILKHRKSAYKKWPTELHKRKEKTAQQQRNAQEQFKEGSNKNDHTLDNEDSPTNTPIQVGTSLLKSAFTDNMQLPEITPALLPKRRHWMRDF